jgi:hypothetical protein
MASAYGVLLIILIAATLFAGERLRGTDLGFLVQ